MEISFNLSSFIFISFFSLFYYWFNRRNYKSNNSENSNHKKLNEKIELSNYYVDSESSFKKQKKRRKNKALQQEDEIPFSNSQSYNKECTNENLNTQDQLNTDITTRNLRNEEMLTSECLILENKPISHEEKENLLRLDTNTEVCEEDNFKYTTEVNENKDECLIIQNIKPDLIDFHMETNEFILKETNNNNFILPENKSPLDLHKNEKEFFQKYDNNNENTIRNTNEKNIGSINARSEEDENTKEMKEPIDLTKIDNYNNSRDEKNDEIDLKKEFIKSYDHISKNDLMDEFLNFISSKRQYDTKNLSNEYKSSILEDLRSLENDDLVGILDNEGRYIQLSNSDLEVN